MTTIKKEFDDLFRQLETSNQFKTQSPKLYLDWLFDTIQGKREEYNLENPDFGKCLEDTIIKYYEENKRPNYNNVYIFFKINDTIINILSEDFYNKIFAKGISSKILEYSPFLIKNAPSEYLEQLINISPFFLNFMDDSKKTISICLLAVRKDSNMLQFVPDGLKTPEMCLQAVASNPLVLQFVPDELKTPEMCLQAVASNPLVLQFVPDGLKTPEMCLQAVASNPLVLQFVPQDLQSKNMCTSAVIINYESLQYINSSHPDYKDICLEAVKNSRFALKLVDKEHSEYFAIYTSAVKHFGLVLQDIDPRLRTIELCEEAVKQNGLALEFVPEEFKSNLYLIAVNQNILALNYLPENLKSYELYLKYIDVNGLLNNIPENYRDIEMCIKALTKNIANNINLLPLECKDIILKEFILKYPFKIVEIPTFFGKFLSFIFADYKDLINSIIETEKNNVNSKLKKISTDVFYYHSFLNPVTRLAPSINTNTNKFIWATDKLDQAIMHIFDVRKMEGLSDDSRISIQPWISRFTIKDEPLVIESKNESNKDIFINIIPEECLNHLSPVLKALVEHEFKKVGVTKIINIDNVFINENNKYILIILNELNKIISNPENHVLGYINNFDQKEIGLCNRNFINNDLIKTKKITQVKKADTNQNIVFPVDYSYYLHRLKLVDYKKYDNLSEIDRGLICEHLEAIAPGIQYQRFRMIPNANHSIFYIDFDDDTEKELQLNVNNLEYWEKKYLKYKKKYLSLSKKVKAFNKQMI
jgi:hypothetical protein